MRQHLKPIFVCSLALLLPACAAQPGKARLTGFGDAIDRVVASDAAGTFNLAVSPLAVGDQPSIVSAQLAGSEVFGLLNLSSQYELQRGNSKQDANVFGTQRFSQGLQGSLPLLVVSPLNFKLSRRIEQQWTGSGLLEQQRSTAQLRWSEDDVQVAVDAHQQSGQSHYSCGLDASVTSATPVLLSPWAGNARDIGISGKLCQRNLSGLPSQQAEIVSAQARWRDDYGSRRLRISHAQVRDMAAGDDAVNAGIEVGAHNVFEVDGWKWKQELAVRPAEAAASAAAWAARTELSRSFFQVPVTASWQRRDASVWSIGADQAPGRETSLGLDLSTPVQQWLAPGIGANVSYHRLQSAEADAQVDEQIRLGLSLDW
jgi:hypothetical protein